MAKNIEAEVKRLMATGMTEAEAAETKDIESSVEDAGGWNTWGYHQFLLDSDR